MVRRFLSATIRLSAAVINYYQRSGSCFGKLKLEISIHPGRVLDENNRVMWTMRAKPPRVLLRRFHRGNTRPAARARDYTVRLTTAGKVYDTKLTVGLDGRSEVGS